MKRRGSGTGNANREPILDLDNHRATYMTPAPVLGGRKPVEDTP